MSLQLRQGVRALIRTATENPPSGQRLLYPKSDGWYDRDSSGNEAKLESSTGALTSARPVDLGLLAMNFDPAATSAGQLLTTAGTLYGARLWTPVQLTVTNIILNVFTAGSNLTANQNKACIFNSAGALLGTTVDQATAWTTTGTKTMAISGGAVTVPAGYFDIGVWRVGNTSPAISRGTSSPTGPNGLLTGQAIRFWTSNNTGLTTTAPATLGTKSNGIGALWFGVS